MAIKSFTRSTIENNIFYRSMLAGNTAYSPSDEDVLAEEILTSSQASVTFSGLSAYAADYQHLQIRLVAKLSSGTGNAGNFYMRFNSDTGSNYAWHRLNGDGTSVTSAASASQTQIVPMFMSRDDGGAAYFSAGVIDILDAFETSKYTTTRSLFGIPQTSVYYVGLNSGVWMNTAALTDISFEVPSYQFAIGSTWTLIGVK